ncbi:MAG: response regulator transcription factor [Actinomycetota bacterium]
MTSDGSAKVLLIEDDLDLAAALELLFAGNGCTLVHASSGEHGLRLAETDPPDVVLLDVDLPGINGPEVCRRLRTFSAVPVVFLTGATDPIDAISGFTAGGDDYVTKPFHPQLLVARVDALLKRPHMDHDGAPIRVGAVAVDTTARVVTVAGEELALTKIEYDLLACLATHLAQIMSRAQLIDQVWGTWSGDDHVVDVNISRLRRKLTAAGADPDLITTHRGMGYRMNR